MIVALECESGGQECDPSSQRPHCQRDPWPLSQSCGVPSRDSREDSKNLEVEKSELELLAGANAATVLVVLERGKNVW